MLDSPCTKGKYRPRDRRLAKPTPDLRPPTPKANKITNMAGLKRAVDKLSYNIDLIVGVEETLKLIGEFEASLRKRIEHLEASENYTTKNISFSARLDEFAEYVRIHARTSELRRILGCKGGERR